MMGYWAYAYEAGNFAGAASVYTETGVLTVGENTYTGREEIEGFFKTFSASAPYANWMTTSEGTDTFSGVYDFEDGGTFDFVIDLKPGTLQIAKEVVTPGIDFVLIL